jgi:amino acid transporter/nucleotide-binding universal stress UspA family protein
VVHRRFVKWSKYRRLAVVNHKENGIERHLGLLAATGVGVGAIVGGGILALAGVAFATTGPSAIAAFAINGVIAMLTALSFAEMASKFPESGGTYTFSRKVLSVEAAFSVGWVVWFASVVAAVLYALGFGHFGLLFVSDMLSAAGIARPTWFDHPYAIPIIAIVTTWLLAGQLSISSGGGGTLANIAKVIVFGVLILGGLWAVARSGPRDAGDALRPFFSNGWSGLIQAMGYSFIALQGFDLIAAVGGEVRNPTKTIPRAMILSLVIALCIYLPLLFVITTVGTTGGQSITTAAAANPEGIVAQAAGTYLGTAGYWLVIVAAVLSMFTALQANVFAASRIAAAMSADRTLPSWLQRRSANRGTPIVAIGVTAALVSILILTIPDIAAAGAASSLIFLVTFAVAHWLAVLVRQRSSVNPPPFRAPLFPFVPVLGGIACLGLAVFQGFAVPLAGQIAVAWLSLGTILFLTLFARRARLLDVSNVAANPELVRLRGNTPLVLVPIANPRNARAMISLADALVPAGYGRVLLQTVVVIPENWNPDEDIEPLQRAQTLLLELLRASNRLSVRAETLTSVSSQPMEEIVRVAGLHRCESVLVGLSDITNPASDSPVERLLSRIDTDVVVLRAAPNWQLADSKKILVPVGGRGGHDHLLTRLLASLSRKQQREITFVRVVSSSLPAAEVKRIRRELDRMAHDNAASNSRREVILSDDPIAAITDRAAASDLVILGIQRIGRTQKLFGSFTRQVASRSACPIIVMSRR